MAPQIIIINQARMTSTRLPGKILKTVLGKTLLEYGIERLQRVKNATGLVIATTVNATDDPVEELCRKLGVMVYRGSESDVLGRYYEAAKQSGAEVVVRVTSDCPLIDPVILEKMIDFFITHSPPYHYVANSMEPSFPHGMDAEVFSMEALEISAKEATQAYDREHVSPYITDNPRRFPCYSFKQEKNQSAYRVTVDYPEDFLVIEKILTELYPKKKNFSSEDVVEVLKAHPDWVLINKR